MKMTVTTKNLITIPPDRAERARRLAGSGLAYAPKRNAVSELIAEREREG